MRKEAVLMSTFLKAVPFLLACSKHRDASVSSFAHSGLLHLATCSSISSLELPPATPRRLARSLAEVITSTAGRSDSWRVRLQALRTAEALGSSRRFELSASGGLSILITLCVKCLEDSSGEVRNVAKKSLSILLLGCSDEECREYTHKFKALAGSHKATKNDPARVMAGVMGLTALVEATPFGVPDWLPETVCSLALYGSGRMPHVVQKHVEK
eukprot:Polyplicarium_translucidae@DN3388_c4_g1_i3.p1